MHVLVDTSSILKRALYAGKDTEFGYEERVINEAGEEKVNWINSAQYGFDNAAQMLNTFFSDTKLNPKDCVFVLEGVNGTRFRKSFYPTYKQGRNKSQALISEYNRLEERFIQTMLGLGAQIAQHDGVEADDLIAWLAQTIKEEQVMIWSFDGDLASLSQYPNVTTYIGNQWDKNPYGNFPVEFLDVYKATVGDSSDKIKGAHGFGDKAFQSVYETFGDNGLKILRRLIETKSLIKLQEDVEKCPSVQKLINNSQEVELSYKCAKFHTEFIQPETIIWQHGINKSDSRQLHPYLAPFAQQVVGVTKANFNTVFEAIKKVARDNLAVILDIETSTPEDSDDWLASVNAAKKGKGQAVDVFGSELVSVQLTLGGNFQYTYDFSVNHAETDNLSIADVEKVLLYLNSTHKFVIHNCNFELTVLKNTFGWFLRDVDDTKLMASYVDENNGLGLKDNSRRWLGYDQTSYAETVTDSEGRQRKMDELTLNEALSYAADDTICTAALYQWFRLYMQLENVWGIYRQVEIGAVFWTAQAFLDGININLATLAEFSKRDKAELEVLENKVFEYLTNLGWEGSVYKPLNQGDYQDPANIKYAFAIVTGQPLNSRKRKFEALLEDIENQGASELRDILAAGDVDILNTYLKSKFQGKPQFNFGSPTQLAKLFYEVMGLPVRLRNKLTTRQRENGLAPSAKTDADAIEMALLRDVPKDDPRYEILETILGIKKLQTRFTLFYNTYPTLPHWKDRKIHANLNQSSTTTRRFSSSSPNLQQFPKGKGDFRKVFEPHSKSAMIVSLDFSAQELRIIAELSQDKNLLSCYVGDALKDMHSTTGAMMIGMPYEEFKAIQTNEDHPRHQEIVNVRKTAKTVNFGTNYGIESESLAITLKCSPDEARQYIEAKDAAFPEVAAWKIRETQKAKSLGYSLTMLGARRHLNAINSTEFGEASKDERRAVNFEIQGSGAEMMKLAMGRMYQSGIREKFGMRFLAVIHDEAVFSIAIEDMPKVIPLIYAAMTAPYADMKVPIQSSVSIGWTFGDQHELGDDVVPTAENLQALISKISHQELLAA